MDSIKSVHVGVVWYEQAQKAMRDVDTLRATIEAKDAEIALHSSRHSGSVAYWIERNGKNVDRIAHLEDDIAGRDTVILRLESELAERKALIERIKSSSKLDDLARIDGLERELADLTNAKKVYSEAVGFVADHDRLTKELAEAKKDTARLSKSASTVLSLFSSPRLLPGAAVYTCGAEANVRTLEDLSTAIDEAGGE